VRGSHIVTRKLYDHDKCYFFQGADGRIIFAIPYETDFTLIGTTDAEHENVSATPECTPEEAEYLCRFASEYFRTPVSREDIVWTYSGVRPLYDDGAKSATAATRDYVLTLDDMGGAPLLNVFGGKITTYRKLAEAAMARIAPFFEGAEREWTAGVALPGGDFAVDGAEQLTADLRRAYPFLDAFWARRLIRAYGTEAAVMLGDAKTPEDLGPDFGATLTGREVAWMMRHEFARSAEDVVWRRTRLGLRLSADQIAALEAWMVEAATQDDATTPPAKSSAALRA
jgi:glycerol-3-phosphate dehydrogenase